MSCACESWNIVKHTDKLDSIFLIIYKDCSKTNSSKFFLHLHEEAYKM
jgi:hypothetical protein